MSCAWRITLWTLLGTLLVYTQAKQLPPGIVPCNRNDPELNSCALKNGQLAIPLLAAGIPEYHMQPMDPLFIPTINIDDEGGVRRIALRMNNVTIHGLVQTKLQNISIDADRYHIAWKLWTPRMNILGKYNISGRILILPILGEGDMNITMVDVSSTVNVFLRPWTSQKHGKTYVSLQNSTMSYRTKRVYMRLENLFNGDRVLGEQMNVFMNENWQEMEKELGPSIVEALNAVSGSIIKAMIKDVPWNEILLDSPVE